MAVLGGTLVAAALTHGGTDYAAWNWCLAALGITGLAYRFAFPSREHAPPIDRAVGVSAVALFAIVVFQLIPLPLPLLELLSPARAELTRALTGIQTQWAAPISIMPERTFAYLLRMCAFLILYWLVRETGWRLSGRAWLAAVPLLLTGLVEACIGLWQVHGAPPSVSAVGTYLNRDLYGGLLAMLIPFPALLLVLVVVRRGREAPRWPIFLAQSSGCGLLLGTMVIALTRSLSRMAVAASIAGLTCAALLFFTRHSGRRQRWLALALAAGFAIGVWALAPRRLAARYGELRAQGQLDANRLPIWEETARLIASYPLTGCGLGCRKSGYLAYKTSLPQFATDYAHSDYLQALAELGVPGFLAALTAAGSLLREVMRAARRRNDPAARSLAVACAASMIGLAIHSLVDFNLHQPATMLVLAWVAGLGSATAVAPVRRDRRAI